MKKLILLTIIIASAFCSFGQHTRATKAYTDTLESQSDAQITVNSTIAFTTITANEGVFTTITSTYAAIDSVHSVLILEVDDGTFTTITVTYGAITDLDVRNDLYAVSVTATDVTIENLDVEQLDADSIYGCDEAWITNGLFTTLEASTSVSVTDVYITDDIIDIDTIHGVDYMSGVNVDLSGDFYTVSATITDQTSTNITADNAYLTTITTTAIDADYADIDSLITLVGYVDSVFSDYLSATGGISAAYGDIDSLIALNLYSSFISVTNIDVVDTLGSSAECIGWAFIDTIVGCSPVYLRGGAVSTDVTVTAGAQVLLDLEVDSISAATMSYVHISDSVWFGLPSTGFSVPNYYGSNNEGLFLHGNAMKWGDHLDTFLIQFTGSYQTVTDGSTVMLSDSSTYGSLFSDNITGDDSTVVTLLGTGVNYTVTFTDVGQEQNATGVDTMITINTPGTYLINASLSGVSTNDSVEVWIIVTENDVDQTNLAGKMTFSSYLVKSYATSGIITCAKDDVIKLTFKGANETFYLRSANLSAIKLD